VVGELVQGFSNPLRSVWHRPRECAPAPRQHSELLCHNNGINRDQVTNKLTHAGQCGYEEQLNCSNGSAVASAQEMTKVHKAL